MPAYELAELCFLIGFLSDLHKFTDHAIFLKRIIALSKLMTPHCPPWEEIEDSRILLV